MFPLICKKASIKLCKRCGFRDTATHTLTKIASNQVTHLEGVVGVRDVHVWKLAGEAVVATLHVQVQDHVDEQKIIKAVQGHFGDVVRTIAPSSWPSARI